MSIIPVRRPDWTLVVLTLSRASITSSWYLPIAYLFYTQRGLSLTQILSFKSVFALGVVLFEVPTGIVADVFTRRISLMLSAICVTASTLVTSLAPNYLILAAAQLVLALGATFTSGALEAAIYDHLTGQGRGSEYRRVYGQIKSVSLWYNLVAMSTGAYLFALHPALPYWITAVAAVIGLVFLWTLKEDLGSSKKRATSVRSYWAHVQESAQIVWGEPELKWALVYQAFFLSTIIFIFELYQFYFTLIGVSARLNGIIYGFFMVIGALASKEAFRLVKRWKNRTLFTGLLSLFAVTAVAMGLVRNILFGILILAAQQLVYYVGDLVLSDFINQVIPDSQKRATLLSFTSMAANVVKFGIVWGGGFLIQSLTFGPGLLITAIVTLCLSILFYRLFPRRNEQTHSVIEGGIAQ